MKSLVDVTLGPDSAFNVTIVTSKPTTLPANVIAFDIQHGYIYYRKPNGQLKKSDMKPKNA